MSKLEINIPSQMIEDAVRAQVVEALTAGKGEELIKAIINQAMTEKRNTYGHETVFGYAVKEMIRSEAKKIFGDWLNSQREALREQLMAELDMNGKKRLKELTEALVQNIGRYSVEVSFRIPD